jgi:hypothetical protein
MKCKILLFLALVPTSALGQVRLTPGADKIEISIDGKPYSTFYMTGRDVTKPYLWPVRAATGTYVTRMWPMENVAEEEKEKKDHPHQRGIWFAHDNVNGIDFWNNEAAYKEPPKRGKMILKKVGKIENGKHKGSLTAVFDWTDREDHVQLTETRVMTFYAEPDRRTIDFDITLKSVEKVVWGDGKDGAFGIRMRPVLDEQGGTGKITNADGLVGEKQLWGKPSNWCDYSGTVGEEKVGVAIFDHPDQPEPSGALACARLRIVRRESVRSRGLYGRQIAEWCDHRGAGEVAALSLSRSGSSRRRKDAGSTRAIRKVRGKVTRPNTARLRRKLISVPQAPRRVGHRFFVACPSAQQTLMCTQKSLRGATISCAAQNGCCAAEAP